MGAFRKYAPSAYLKLIIRLEDFTRDQDTSTPSEKDAPKPSVAELQKKEDVARNKWAEASVALATGGSSSSAMGPLQRDLDKAKKNREEAQRNNGQSRSVTPGSGDDYTIELATIPIDMSVEMNSFRIADTLSATFPFIDAPLISEIIRSALVEVWEGTVDEKSFGTLDHWKLDLRSDNPRSVLVFRGYVDTWDTNHDDSNATVQIQARSMESILIDAKVNPRASAYNIAKDEKISDYLNRIFAFFPATSGAHGSDALRAVWYGADPAAEPILSKDRLKRSLQRAAARNAAAGGDRGTQTVVADQPEPNRELVQEDGAASAPSSMPPKSLGQPMSLWDLVTQACEIAGCLPCYDPSLPIQKVLKDGRTQSNPPGATKDYLLLRPAQTMFDEVSPDYKVPGGSVDGFTRKMKSADGHDMTAMVRFLVWGHNVKSMKTSRKLGRIKLQGIEVVSYNDDGPPSQRRLSEIWPPDAFKSKTNAKGDDASHEVRTIVIHGIRDSKLLKQIACGVYHSMCRQEISVSIETNDLCSYVDPVANPEFPDSPDMLKLRPGAPCCVAVAREVRDPSEGLVISPLSEVFEKRKDALRELLVQRNQFDVNSGTLDRAVDRIMAALNSAKLQDIYYCRTVRHTFSADDGWSAQIELVNYLKSRVDLSATAQAVEDEAKIPAKKRKVSSASKSAAKVKASGNEVFNRSKQRVGNG